MDSSPVLGTAEQASNVAKVLLAGVEMLRETALFRFTRDEQLEYGRELEQLHRAWYATEVAWVRELENSGAAAELSYSSTRTLLKNVLLISTGDAADRVRAATMALPGEPLSGGRSQPSCHRSAKP